MSDGQVEIETQASGNDGVASDAKQFDPGFGKGGVPLLLLIFYLSFLAFFTWYVLEYQLPDFLKQGPGQSEQVSGD